MIKLYVVSRVLWLHLLLASFTASVLKQLTGSITLYILTHLCTCGYVRIFICREAGCTSSSGVNSPVFANKSDTGKGCMQPSLTASLLPYLQLDLCLSQPLSRVHEADQGHFLAGKRDAV